MRRELPDYMKKASFSYQVLNERVLAVFFPYDENPILMDYSEVQRWSRIFMEVYPAIESIRISLDGEGVMMVCAKKEEYV